ncbi:LCP family protein [Phytoactinopolyspora endophytica]|uniref:LCP family protein n=1 Tax=Phytoactinopolyspora endophytica TaxID=1642495 RepID=UPI00101DB2FF|nr:LCP family protein [Phytoactinopolyspora endophytica]
MPRQDHTRRSSSEHARSERRQASSTGPGNTTSYPRFLGLSIAGTLVPGLGLITAGRRWIGWSILSVFLVGVAAMGAYLYRAGDVGLVRLGTNPDRINTVGYGLIGIAAVWLLVTVISFYALEPRGLRPTQRLLAAFLVVLVASAVIAPMGIGSRYAFTQRNFIQSVFPDEREYEREYDRDGNTIEADTPEADPWADRGRINVLLLGSDAGDNRDGVRTDTVMVASVDTDTGDTALFSLPRNLQRTPFPEGELRDAYPEGFRGEPASEYWLSSIYKNIPSQFPEFFEGEHDPGAEAMKLAVGEALGLEIDYHVMVNLDGFEAIVDALGGVVIDVPYDIPMGTQVTSWGTCTEPRAWIENGDQQRLDGDEALWFARARCGPPPINDDYERMRRQRCMIGAIAEQVDPFTLLTRYLHLERAVRDNFTTDISQQRLEDFAELGLRIQDAEIRSLPFTDEIIDYGNPDYDVIRAFVQDSLAEPGDHVEADADPDDHTDDDGTIDRPDGEATALPDDDTDSSDIGAGTEEGDGVHAEDADEDVPSDNGEPERTDESDGAQSIDDVC